MTTSEQQLIPFKASSLLGENVLVLAPHPDDEIIGCGGLLTLHADQKRRVRVVVVTDGSAAEAVTSADYVSRRESETRAGLESLGVTDVRFLRFADRSLSENSELLRSAISRELKELLPDLLLVTSPLELHPDHAALADTVISLLQSSSELTATMATTRVAFYEVSQPFRPNVLVDISSVAERKYSALALHASQTALRDYEHFARGLNAYRTMTLGDGAKYAEGYFVSRVLDIPLTSSMALTESMAATTTTRMAVTLPSVSVILRTRNRPALLQNALASIRNSYDAAEIVIVNDGGSTIEPPPEGVTLVQHATSRGRAAALNSGVAAASGELLAFLDDDDLYFPEHLPLLAAAAAREPGNIFYSDAVSSEWIRDEQGQLVRAQSRREYQQEFDRDLLLIDNYIPLPCVIVPRKACEEAGGFDEAFDLFEDWDFLIRLATTNTFVRIPTVTCEVRHVEATDSIVMATRKSPDRFHAARVQIWRKHGVLSDAALLSKGLEAKKSHENAIASDLFTQRGQSAHLRGDVHRLTRDKENLLEQLDRSTESDRRQQQQIIEKEALLERLRGEIDASEDRNRGLLQRVEELESLLEVSRASEGDFSFRLRDVQDELSARDQQLHHSYEEITRLNQLLSSIYGSRSWKLHKLAERFSRTRG